MSFSGCKKIFNPFTPSLNLKLPGNSTVIPKITCNVEKFFYFFQIIQYTNRNFTSTNIPNCSGDHCKMYMLKMTNITSKAFYSWIIQRRQLLLLLHPLFLLSPCITFLLLYPLAFSSFLLSAFLDLSSTLPLALHLRHILLSSFCCL